jgi:hypothetical protein
MFPRLIIITFVYGAVFFAVQTATVWQREVHISFWRLPAIPQSRLLNLWSESIFCYSNMFIAVWRKYSCPDCELQYLEIHHHFLLLCLLFNKYMGAFMASINLQWRNACAYVRALARACVYECITFITPESTLG